MDFLLLLCMAKIILPLTSKQVKEAKPRPRAYKLFDGGGLILAVYPTGKKVWRLDYYDLNKKRKTYTIGDASYISLADARKKRDELKSNLENEQSISKKDAITFGPVFYEWFEKWKLLVVPTTAKRALSSIEKDCFPVLQNLEISKIRPRDIVEALDPIDKRCSYETLLKIKSALKLSFDYAIARGLCEMDPVSAVTQAAFTKTVKGNYRTLPLTEIYRLHEYFQSDRNSIITSVLLNLYRKFEGITIGETWSMQDKLDYPEEFGYQYQNICQLLNIEPLCIYDFYTQDEIKENEWTQSDITQILKDEQPSFAEIYIEYIRTPYSQKVFSALKKHLNASDLYVLMMNAASYDHFNKQYEQWEEDTNEDYEFEFFDMNTLDDFKESIKRNEMHILSDMEFIHAYEWLDRNY